MIVSHRSPWGMNSGLLQEPEAQQRRGQNGWFHTLGRRVSAVTRTGFYSILLPGPRMQIRRLPARISGSPFEVESQVSLTASCARAAVIRGAEANIRKMKVIVRLNCPGRGSTIDNDGAVQLHGGTGCLTSWLPVRYVRVLDDFAQDARPTRCRRPHCGSTG